MDRSTINIQLTGIKGLHSPNPLRIGRESERLKFSSNHPTRDLKVIVKVDSGEQVWTVSSWAMSLVSGVWEQKILEADEQKHPISCVDDDIHALEALLNVAHRNFEAIPKTVTFDQLIQLAVICDKYKAAKAFEDRPGRWIRRLQTSSETLNHEGWLLIAWTFVETDIIQRVARHVLMNIYKYRTQGPISRGSVDYEYGWRIGERILEVNCIPRRVFGEIHPDAIQPKQLIRS